MPPRTASNTIDPKRIPIPANYCPPNDTMARFASLLTTRQVALLTGFSLQKVQSLIRGGRLHAVDTSTGSNKPRWGVPEAALYAFLTPVSHAAVNAPMPTGKRSRIDAHVKNKIFG